MLAVVPGRVGSVFGGDTAVVSSAEGFEVVGPEPSTGLFAAGFKGSRRFPSVTRFGSPSRPVESASALLRVSAAAAGVDLHHAGPVDLLAASVGADAWCVLTGRTGFDAVHLLDDPPRRVLAAVLTRSAGVGGSVCQLPVDECATSPALLRLAEEHLSWAHELCPDAADLVIVKAASDLSAGGQGSSFFAYAALLQLLL